MERNRAESPVIPDRKAFFYRPSVHFLLIAVIGLLAYSNTFHSPFQWDEEKYLVANPVFHNLSYFAHPSMVGTSKLYGTLKSRYIGYLTFALNYRIGGLNVVGYHVVNLGIHIVNALLVYLLVFFTFKTPFLQESVVSRHSGMISLCCALLFVVHPVQTEAVTYIFQRLASLVTMFYLLSAVLYIKGRLITEETQSKSRGKKNGGQIFFFLSLVSAVLAMETKENAFTLPLVVTLYEFLFFSGSVKSRMLRLVPLLLTMVIVPVALLGLLSPGVKTVRAIKGAVSIGFQGFPREAYLLTQFRVIVTYLRLLLLPMNQNIDYDYPLYHSPLALPVLLSFLCLAAILGAAVYLLYKARGNKEKGGNNMPSAAGHNLLSVPSSYRLMAFGILWFFITVSVESSVIPIPMLINEYRVYLPSVGVFVTCMTALFTLFNRHGSSFIRQGKKMAAAVLILTVFLLTALTYARNSVWRDRISLWQDVVVKSPNKANGYLQLGHAYDLSNRYEKSVEMTDKAVALSSSALGYLNRGIVLAKMGRTDEAIADMNRAIAMEPSNYSAYFHRGSFYDGEGRFERAKEDYSKAIALNPFAIDAYVALGVIYGKSRSFDKAIELFNRALAIDPHYENAYDDRGLAFSLMGRYDQALRDLDKAIALAPKSALGYIIRGNLYLKTGNRELAQSDFRRACDLKDERGCRALLDAFRREPADEMK